MKFIINLLKSKTAKKKKKTTKKSTKKGVNRAKKDKKELPPGGVWRTIRGAKVYIHNGKVIAGAEGKLSDFDYNEITAIHEARENKKSYDNIIFVGTKVKVGKERRVGEVVKETKSTYHIKYDNHPDYPKGTVRKVPKSKVKRADSYKLKLEERIERANGGKHILLGEEAKKVDKQKMQQIRESEGQAAKDAKTFAEDLIMREESFDSIKAPVLKRDEDGNPVKKPVFDEDGNPVIDPYTGKQKMKYVYEEVEDATEDDLLRDHQGLIISEIVNPHARKYGLDFIQRQWRDEDGNPIDLYGDLVQTANIGFLYGLREYAQKAAKGEKPTATLLTHALMRSKQEVQRHAQNLLNTVSLPVRMMAPLAIVSQMEETLEKELGRKPTDIEIAERLKGNPTFNQAKVTAPPYYDKDKEEFVEMGEINDPVEKVRAIKRAKLLQKPITFERTVAGGNERGDKAVVLGETIEGSESYEKQLIAKQEVEERIKKLKELTKKLFKKAGLTDDELKIITLRFGIGNNKQKDLMSLEDIAQKLGKSKSWVKKYSSRAMNKLKNAPVDQLEALKKIYMIKSLGLDNLMKALYVYDLKKSLEAFGLGIDDLDTRFIRIASGSLKDIKKSLDITEFIGSVTIVGSEKIQARIIEYVLPDSIDLVEKAYSNKKTPKERHKSIKKWANDHPDKVKHHITTQVKALEGKKTLTWSERMVVETPGAWITWHGHKVFINGAGDVLYDRDVPAMVEKYNKEGSEPHYNDDTDLGHEAVHEMMETLQEKWKGSGNTLGGYVKDWRDKARKDGPFSKSDKLKKKVSKQFPEGKFLIKNPYTGKKAVVVVEAEEYEDKKGPNARTVVKYAFDPDADEKLNIGNWAEIRRHLFGNDFNSKENHYEFFMNKGNMAGNHTIEVLDDNQYNDLYNQTTEGMIENMSHTNWRDVTPKMMTKLVYDPHQKKHIPVQMEYSGPRVYEADLGNGRVSRVEIDENGMFIDPVMQKLINPVKPIKDANDLYTAFKAAIGNETWVTISSSKLDKLNHHVKIKYDGQGAPIVVGGVFDGYRFQDANEVDDLEEKKRSLFRGGQPVRTALKKTEAREVDFKIGNKAKIRDPEDRRKWIEVKITGHPKKGQWQVELPEGKVFKNGANIKVLSEDELRHSKVRYNIAQEAPVLDTADNGMLNITVPKEYISDFRALGVNLDDEGRANISIKQFMDIRDEIGSFSLTNQAREFLENYYSNQERSGKPDINKLYEKYNPNNMEGFREDSFLKQTNFYNTQVEAMEHLLNAKKGIAGHGMGTGKTLIGVGASMYLRNKAIKEGKKPRKTLIIAPSAIRSEWLKEINRHTKVGAVVVAGDSEDGNLLGQVKGTEDLRSKVIGSSKYNGNHDEHFVIMSRTQFLKEKNKMLKLVKEGKFENIILDEVHALKTPGGRGNETLMELGKYGENVWGLSGTPADNEIMDAYHLIHAVTGGEHDLGTEKDFIDTYMLKDGTKIAGINESKMDELGKKLNKYLHFRNGYDDIVLRTNPKTGEKERVKFPHVDASNRYHGSLNHVVEAHEVTTKDGKIVKKVNPKTELEKKVYKRYAELEKRYLTENQMQNLMALADTGTERSASGGKESKNYLPGVQKLQQFLNAPHSVEAYYTITKNKEGKSTGSRSYPYEIDENGHKRYYKAKFDEKGNPIGYETTPDGKPVLLPPMHHNNPKALKLKETILSQLKAHEKEMQRRMEYNKTLKPGEKKKPIYPPKIVIASKYDGFGVEVVENVLKDLSRDTGYDFSSIKGSMTDVQKNEAKTKFQTRESKVSFIAISDSAKEGIDLGNAHMLIHYDQDFNPNKMAQKSARALRSDSWKHAEAEDRENRVKIESLVMPGTIEDAIIRAQNRKMEVMEEMEIATRRHEGTKVQNDYAQVYAGSQRKWVQKKRSKKVDKETFKQDEKTASMETIPLIIRL